MRALRKTMTDVKQKLGSDIEALTTKLVESEAKREKAEQSLQELTENVEKRLNERLEEAAKKSDRIEEMLSQLLARKPQENADAVTPSPKM